MGTLISQPYALADGQEYVGYLEHVIAESQRLIAEGRMPSDEGLVAFFEDAQHVLGQVRRDVNAATAAGQPTVQSHVDFTAQEYARYRAMGESARTLLEILALRDALVLNRTEAVARVADAFTGAQFVE
jgi:hypothetical protein